MSSMHEISKPAVLSREDVVSEMAPVAELNSRSFWRGARPERFGSLADVAHAEQGRIRDSPRRPDLSRPVPATEVQVGLLGRSFPASSKRKHPCTFYFLLDLRVSKHADPEDRRTIVTVL